MTDRQAWARWAASWTIIAFTVHWVFSTANSNAPTSYSGSLASTTLWLTVVFAIITIILLGWEIIIRLIRENVKDDDK